MCARLRRPIARNPATSLKLASIAHAGEKDVDAAVQSARKAYDSSWKKMPAKGVDPILGFAEKVPAFFMLVLGRAGRGRHVALLSRMSVVNSGVIAVVKIGVCFHIEMFGKKPPALTQSYREEIGRLSAVAHPTLKPRLQICRQTEANGRQ